MLYQNNKLRFSVPLVFRPASRIVTLALFLMVFTVGSAMAQTRAYVANVGSSDVSVIDTATNGVVATIPLGRNPYQVAVSPNGASVYTTNFDGTVSVIDAAARPICQRGQLTNQQRLADGGPGANAD